MSIQRWPSNNDPLGESRKCKPMEVTVKLRLLLASALLMFVQIAMTHAQETVDVAKITCQQILKEELASPTHDIVLGLADTTTASVTARSSISEQSTTMRRKFAYIATKTPTRPFWMPSKTCSGWTNEV